MRNVLLFICVAIVVSKVQGRARRCGTGRSCVSGMARCVRGSCRCESPYTWGDPSFACYEEDDVAAEIKNDPELKTFGNETLQFPFPCRYLVTHIMQELKDRRDRIIGHCEFMVYGYNAKYRGKFYTLGFDVAARLKYENTDKEITASSRIYGVGRRGRYLYRVRGTMGQFVPDGPWGRDRVNYHDQDENIKIDLKQDTRNEQIVYEVLKCGLRITFVPYDVIARLEQVTVPGLAVTVKDAYHWHSEPQWLSDEKVMALAPLIAGGRHIADLRRRGLSGEQSMLYRAFVSGVEQNQPYEDRGQCALAGRIMSSCSRSRRMRAMKYCDWMLLEPKFIYCFDRTTGARAILRLFNMCLEVHCSGGSCSDVTEEILDVECETFGDSAARFVQSGRCRL